MPDLTTPRLVLHELTLAEGDALHAGRRPDGWAYEEQYPLPDTKDGVAFLVRHRVEPFGFYFVVRREDGLVIGEIGFAGPPVEGSVMIGYAIVPSARGKGYATEAIEALAGWALSRPEVDVVRAQTLPDNEPSARALLRAGFSELEPGPSFRRFALARSRAG